MPNGKNPRCKTLDIHQVMFSSKAADAIKESGAKDFLYDGSEDDTLNTEDSDDQADFLFGGEGNDWLSDKNHRLDAITEQNQRTSVGALLIH